MSSRRPQDQFTNHFGRPEDNGMLLVVGSVKVNFLSYRYRADKSTIFGMRGLWGLTINSGRGATLKYL